METTRLAEKEAITLTICFLGTSDSYPLHADRLVGRVYNALGGEEFVHKVIIDGPGSGGLDLDRRWDTDRAWNKIMGVTFGAGMADNVANALAIIKRRPTRPDKEGLAAAVKCRGQVRRVNLFGHSRGGVQCYRLAWDMYHDPETAQIEVNCVVMDPVPGPANSFLRRNSTLTPNVRHAQVWVAEHEHSLGFEALLPTVMDPSQTCLWLDLLPGNHVNMCVDATLEPLLIDASGRQTAMRLEPELFRLSFALTVEFLARHHSLVGGPNGPAYLLTVGEYLRLYDSIARRWDAYCSQASMLQWARATVFERNNMRRVKQKGEFNVLHFPDIEDFCEFYRLHRSSKPQGSLPVVNRHHDLLQRHGVDVWEQVFSGSSSPMSSSPATPILAKTLSPAPSPPLPPASNRPSWSTWDALKMFHRLARPQMAASAKASCMDSELAVLDLGSAPSPGPPSPSARGAHGGGSSLSPAPATSEGLQGPPEALMAPQSPMGRSEVKATSPSGLPLLEDPKKRHLRTRSDISGGMGIVLNESSEKLKPFVDGAKLRIGRKATRHRPASGVPCGPSRRHSI